MRNYFTCTVISLFVFINSHAQEASVTSDIDRISTPYVYFSNGTYNGQNLLFYNEWVKGKLLTSNNTVIYNESYFFNYDKVERRLLITTDFDKIYQIDWREFKAVLFYRHDTGYVYKHVVLVSDKDLFQVLINGDSKYSLFKTIHTKVVKNRYGGTFSGKSVDKYVDLPEYCILFPNREYRLIHFLKKPAIERAFEQDSGLEKVNNFLNNNNKNIYDEEDLMQLIDYLNKSS
jgi:hypothetical protein